MCTPDYSGDLAEAILKRPDFEVAGCVVSLVGDGSDDFGIVGVNDTYALREEE